MIAFHKFKDSSLRLLVTLQIQIRSGESGGGGGGRGWGGGVVGEHNKSGRQIVSICVSRPNPEVELNQMESADTAR